MGERLMRYYKFVTDEMGLMGKVRLAQETKVPSTQAAIEPDTPEIVRMFKDAAERITGKPAPSL